MRFRALLVCLVVVGLAAGAWAQEVTGTIVGTVKDPSGAVIPGATVTVTNLDKNIVVRAATTDSNGNYVAPLLPIGRYSVSVEARGFQKYTQGNIELNVADRLTVNATLGMAGEQAEVTVESNPVQVELQSMESAGLISGTQIREMPLNNRNYAQLLTLMPGVSSTASDQLYVGNFNPLGTNVVAFSINGARTSSNNWAVDGADNVDRGANLTLLVYPSVDAIAEFKVHRSLYSAEFGRSGAGQINVITRSGTNDFHGGAYEFWRNDKLNANSYFNNRNNVARPKLRYHNFGWNLGGPVYIPGVYNQEKNKTFFFFSQEWRRVITYSTMTGFTPTDGEKQGNFSQAVCVAFDTAGACTQYGTSIAQAQWHPIAAAYVQDIWSPTQSSTDPLTHRIVNPVRNLFNFRQELVKIDHVFSPNLSIWGRYMKDTIPTEEPGGLFTGAGIPGVGNTKTNSPGRNIVGRVTASFSPTFLVEAGYNYSYGAILSEIAGLMNAANSPNVDASASPVLPFQTALTGSHLPHVTLTGLSSLATFGPYDDRNYNHNPFAGFTKIFGSHTTKWGATYHSYRKIENAGGGAAGTFAINDGGVVSNANCGTVAPLPCDATSAGLASRRAQQAWANFLQGRVGTYTQASEDLKPDIRAKHFEIYFQDEWRARQNLTITAGVRYSNFRQPIDKNRFLTNFDPRFYDPAKAPTIDPLTGNLVLTGPTANPAYDPLNGILPTSGALQLCQELIAVTPVPKVPYCWTSAQAEFGQKVTNENNSDFAPRIGFSWDPWSDGKTAIRGGYGVFYDTILVGILEQNAFGNPPFVRNIVATNGTLSNPLGGTTVVSSLPLRVGSRASAPYQTPYSQQWSFDVQREFPLGFLFDVGYYGAKGTHLIGIIDINSPRAGEYVDHPELGIVNNVNANGLCVIGGLPPPCPVNSGNNSRLNAIRPYKGFAAIDAIRTMFNSNYHSLQANLTKRFSGNSYAAVAYTWSKSLTDNQTDRSTAPQNTYDIAAEYGPSQQDRTHILTGNFVYELPWYRNQEGVLGKVLGGWQFSGIVTAQAGTPLTAATNRTYDPAGQGCVGPTACTMRPDIVGDPNEGGGTFLQWFNTAAFAEPPADSYRPGTSRRGDIRGPGYSKVDLSLYKNLRFTERFTTQLRFEAYNIFNHTNFLGVNTTVGSSTYGQITSTRDPRIMQLGAKFNF